MFAIVGFLRGWTKEVVATAGIILALFASQQLSTILIEPLIQGAKPEQAFYLYSLLLLVITFFAYQTPGTAARLSEGRMWGGRREGLQERLLGMIVGGINGYLIFGSIWFYLFKFDYPVALAPYIIAPPPGSASAAFVNALPLNFLAQSNLLTILVIVLFLFVIIALV